MYKDASPKLNYCNFSDDAGYVFTEISHVLYLQSCNVLSPWTKVPGFCHETVVFEIFHVGPLGFDRDLCGSFLLELLERGRLGSAATPHDEILKTVLERHAGLGPCSRLE